MTKFTCQFPTIKRGVRLDQVFFKIDRFTHNCLVCNLLLDVYNKQLVNLEVNYSTHLTKLHFDFFPTSELHQLSISRCKKLSYTNVLSLFIFLHKRFQQCDQPVTIEVCKNAYFLKRVNN